MSDICHQCENEYQNIALHWTQSSDCSRPSLTKQQIEISTGLLMGDGWVDNKDAKNPRISSEMISKNYLEYIDSTFDIFGNGVKMKRTAEESAKQARERNFSPNAKPQNYSDTYTWRSMTHPEFQQLADWYSSGEKVWPSNIELTPTVLKHWYCCDGHWENNNTHNYVEIAMSNESEYTDKVDQLFRNVGLPSPNTYKRTEREDGSVKCSAQFTVEQSKELWDYMGQPLPDFEYKWPEEYIDEH